jgi:NAD(P)-dependent dehydrogenase (short-subunit alcohol dehydrogenase family)
MRLQNKIAVVTGGNSGIGLAIADLFNTEGAEVVMFGRNQNALDTAVAQIGNGTLAVQGDVSKLDDLERL